MSFLETTQIILNIAVSVAFIAVTIVIVLVGVVIVRLLLAMKQGVEAMKKESMALKMKVNQMFDQANIVSRISTWFKKKKSAKK